MIKTITTLIVIFSWLFSSYILTAQELVAVFGQEIQWQDIADGNPPEGKPVNWYQVNTDPETWRVEEDILICSGLPIGVIHSEKEYENFILHIEWRHMEAEGNSGTLK